jgi:cobalt-precorrin-5B (C1)-methyltransferase
METLVACALSAGADVDTLRRVLDAVSTDAALAILDEAGLLTPTVDMLARRISATFARRVPAGVDVEWICFMRADAVFQQIARSQGAAALVERWAPR